MLMAMLYNLFRPRDLEHLTDAEFERYCMRADTRRGDLIWLVPYSIGFGVAICFVAIGLGLAWLLAKGAPVNWLRIGVLNILLGIMLTLIVGSVIRYRLTLKTVRQLLNKAACPFCEFSLFGLRCESSRELGIAGSDHVTCPECGERFSLSDHGLSATDLINPFAPPPPVASAGPLGAYLPAKAGDTKRIRIMRSGIGRPTPRGGQASGSSDSGRFLD
jgi:hypothetical protein